MDGYLKYAKNRGENRKDEKHNGKLEDEDTERHGAVKNEIEIDGIQEVNDIELS